MASDDDALTPARVRVNALRACPDDAPWQTRLAAGLLTAGEVDAMAQRLAAFHRDAAVAAPDTPFGSPAVQARITRGLIDGIDGWRGTGDTAWAALRAWLVRQLDALAPLWTVRRRHGQVREGHGDLHLAHLLTLGGAPAAFDVVAFDDELRWIDVLDDVALPVMDLTAHGRRDLAFRLLDGWLESTGDHDGLPALRFHLVRRALMRARVAARVRGQGVQASAGCDADGYLALASALSRGADARLAITHGLPGSGKSFVSQALVGCAGAIRVRADVERKRLFGLGALESSHGRVPGGIYTRDANDATHARLHRVAAVGLAAGWPVIVDAAFLRRAERDRFAALATDLGVPFTLLDCRATPDMLHRRLVERRRRGGDASEADPAVLERLRGFDEPLDAQEAARAIVCDAAAPVTPSEMARRWLEAG